MVAILIVYSYCTRKIKLYMYSYEITGNYIGEHLTLSPNPTPILLLYIIMLHIIQAHNYNYITIPTSIDYYI